MAATGGGTVLLTGATGFLGPYAASALTQAGWRVRAALRSEAGFQGDAVVTGPLGATTDWTRALEGIDAVVHLAGRAHRPQSVQRAERDAYFEINTAGTLQLARQAAAAGVKHVVFVSSIAVNGATTEGRPPFRESDTPAPVSVYGETKAAAEQGLRAIAAQTGLAVTAVRLPMIYGRNAKGSFHTLARAIAAGLPLPLASIDNRRAFIAAENAADFLAFVLAREASGFSVFVAADQEQVSTADFSRRVALAMGRRALLLPLPPALLKSALRLAQKPDLIESIVGSLELDTGRALAAGWRPPLSLDEGLARALSAGR
jgi:UDP-glucose 4-epimerase